MLDPHCNLNLRPEIVAPQPLARTTMDGTGSQAIGNLPTGHIRSPWNLQLSDRTPMHKTLGESTAMGLTSCACIARRPPGRRRVNGFKKLRFAGRSRVRVSGRDLVRLKSVGTRSSKIGSAEGIRNLRCSPWRMEGQTSLGSRMGAFIDESDAKRRCVEGGGALFVDVQGALSEVRGLVTVSGASEWVRLSSEASPP